MEKIVSYLRVSTKRQGQSGLGIEAQRAAIGEYTAIKRAQHMGEFAETESGKDNDRAQLAAALRACRLYGATLVIAKLDRLSRNAAFLLELRDSGVAFVCCDMPEANSLTIGIMALMAQHEREMISARTKAALQAAKARGIVLGGNRGAIIDGAARAASQVVRASRAKARASDLLPIISELRAEGRTSLRQIAAGLIERGIPTSRGKSGWTPESVRLVMQHA